MPFEGLYGKTVAVCSRKGSSRRTRNRIFEGGPEFVFVGLGNPQVMKVDCALLRSIRTGWCGWLPLSEIVMEEKDD